MNTQLDMYKISDNKKYLLEMIAEKRTSAISLYGFDAYLCDLIEPLMDKIGKKYEVISGKKDKRVFKPDQGYKNAGGLMLSKDLGYVEGYISKGDCKVLHAWNVDNEGNHIDYSRENAGDYEYVGIIIPYDIVTGVGLAKGGVWGPVLPFINEDDWGKLL